MKQKIIFFLLYFLAVFTADIFAVTATFSPTSTACGANNFTVTTTWDDSLACQGSQTTILFNIKRTGMAMDMDCVYPVQLQGFVPITSGFACPVVIPPSPLGFT